MADATESGAEHAASWWGKLKGWFTTAKDSETAEKAGEMAGKAWDKTKDVADKAWDKTKDVADKTWDKTKDVAGDVKEKIDERRKGEDDAADDE